ncbi:MAG TPA: hypothetical protein VGC65_03530 [Bacteroidia bacterium]|jgi:hypothetical protein
MKWSKIKIHYLARLAIFWLLFFALFRILFIVYHHTRIPDGQHSETSLSFLYALQLDLATTCALMVIPFILWALQQFYKSRMIHNINLAYNIFMISVVSILSIFNIKIYGEYGTLMNTEDLVYLLYPKEAVTFLSLWSLLLLLAASAFFAYIGIRSYRRNITSFSLPYEHKTIRLLQIILIPIILFLGLRGGAQAIPVNEEDSHYSGLKINNDIATNNIWYLGNSIYYRKGHSINELQ